MTRFFQFQTDVPAGAGFSLFDRFHLTCLAAAVLLCALGARWFSRRTRRTQRRVSLVLSVGMAVSELLRLLLLYAIGHLTVSVLPLHLCSMTIWLCLFYQLTEADWPGQTLYALCVPGAAAALLFPDWVVYPPFNYFCIHGFAIHTVSILYVILQVSSGRIRPSLQKIGKPILFLCVVVPPIYLFDRAFSVNYMFVNGASPGSPLVPLEQWLGNPGYLLGFALLLAAVMVAMLLPWQLRSRYKKK